MAETIHCRDVGFDCNEVIRGETREELLAKAAEHARKVHGLTEITPETLKKVQAVIRQE
jgi:predicted small metal-binding protein